jgi:hypothetical protein
LATKSRGIPVQLDLKHRPGFIFLPSPAPKMEELRELKACELCGRWFARPIGVIATCNPCSLKPADQIVEDAREQSKVGKPGVWRWDLFKEPESIQ